jgi:hypothetical protein
MSQKAGVRSNDSSDVCSWLFMVVNSSWLSFLSIFILFKGTAKERGELGVMVVL